ncbi:MAG TPA: glycoside hydrolase family 15 protein [Methylomirabilota bacterium]|nr:glycoside hydrolase family 15 protein [Methylomirabilota bacterium]
MSDPIEDYALIGDGETAALVSRRGSIDWLCLPRFDSPACFAALLGGPEHGRFGLAPRDGSRSVRRRYRDGTLVLETDFETADGAVTVVDCMPQREGPPVLIRQVVGRRGTVPMRMELVIRMDYGSVVPWVRRSADGIHAVAGPEALALTTDLPLRGEGLTTVADFEVAAGKHRSLTLAWHPSHLPAPQPLDPEDALRETEAWWRRWVGACRFEGPDRDAVVRSLVTIKALIYEPTGGIVAAPTTSLPERLGGVRNWDYRICWVRDATFALYALVLGGYLDEARAWRQWLLRALAGTPEQVQVMYGLAGERRLTEIELPWLPGYAGSAPVRIGNAAHAQFQLDVWGEMLDAAHAAERHGLERDAEGSRVITKLMEHLESVWTEPDEGIWEVRGPRRHFTHSKVMAWVAADRMVKLTEAAGGGEPDRWRALGATIHADVCRRGFDPARNAFVQAYGAPELDASLLMIPLVGFLPAEDPRVRGTVAAIEHELMVDGLVMRYPTESGVDGLPAGEGVFLACSFWMVDNLVLQGRPDEARRLFDRLLGLRNDVGLLAEQYDPRARRQLGNFPQALSHIALINSASNLSGGLRAAVHRAGR